MSGVWSTVLGSKDGDNGTSAATRHQKQRQHENEASGGSYQPLGAPQHRASQPNKDYHGKGVQPESQELLSATGAGDYYRESLYAGLMVRTSNRIICPKNSMKSCSSLVTSSLD